MLRRFIFYKRAVVHSALLCLMAIMAVIPVVAENTSGSSLTMWTELHVDPNWSATQHNEPIYVARMVAADELHRSALALVWHKEDTGWFTTWKLQLVSETGLLARDGWNGGARQTVDLLTLTPQRGRGYTAAMSYDSATGFISVQITDAADNYRLISNGFAGQPGHDVTYYEAPIGAMAAQVNRVVNDFVPVGTVWGTGRTATPQHDGAQVIAPTEPLRVHIDPVVTGAPGTFRLYVEQGEQRHQLFAVTDLKQAAAVPIDPAKLPTGAFQLALEYNASGDTLWREQVDVSRGWIDAGLNALAVDEVTGAYTGTYNLNSAVELAAVPVQLHARAEQVMWDAALRRYVAERAEENTVLDTVVSLQEGTNTIEFAGSLPVDAASSLWRFHFTPRIDYPIHTNVAAGEQFVALGLTECSVGVMSYNIRFPSSADGVNMWPNRIDLTNEVIDTFAPDIIGFQEPWEEQLMTLDRNLAGYERISIRPDRRAGVHNALYYNKDRLQRLEWGRFWLSDTPDVAQSITWGNNEARAVIWARFRIRAIGQEFYVLNTHYHHIDPDGTIGDRSSQVVLDRLKQLVDGLPIVLLGDFNAQPGTLAYNRLVGGDKAQFADAWEVAAQREGPAGTFHGFTGDSRGRRIDWILVSDDIRVMEMKHIDMKRGNVFPSDHYPIYASICLPN